MTFICEKTKHLIANFRRVVNVVFFLLGNSPASELYVPKFRNTQSVPSSSVAFTRPMKMEQTQCSEKSAHKNQMPENYPKEGIQQDNTLFVSKIKGFQIVIIAI